MKINLNAREFLVRSLIYKFTVFILVSILLVASGYADTKKIVVLGDSLSAGYGLGPGEAFPEQLQKLLEEQNVQVVVVNAGVSGDTSAAGLARLDWSIPDDIDGVIVELGANDALRGISPEVTLNNIETIITKLHARKIHVLLAGMIAPPNMGDVYGQAFNSLYPNLAKKHNIDLYPFFLDGVAANSQLNQADGIHPTAEGITLIAKKFLPSALAFIDDLNE